MKQDNDITPDFMNPDFMNAWNLITNTQQSVFLTGKAGTGKSTFLRYICETTKKKFVVLAPTGIAAVNVGGMTIHSFFKMPLKPLLPYDADFTPKNIRKTLKYPKDKVKIIKELELIIIDEISMVRADMIDFIDKVLRIYSGNMREPFGGKQLLLVGDVFQLEPVVTVDMRQLLQHAYRQFFFFNANAFKVIDIVSIELRKIYRQTDSRFISVLDRIRINKASRDDIALINSRYVKDFKDDGNDFVITLATRRDTVDVINEQHLAELSSDEYLYEGKINGSFPLQNLPTSQNLELKVGAQVIFVKNDKDGRWINGTIGKVERCGVDDITVELENGESYTVEPAEWENMQYTYDEKEKRIKEVVLGTFVQFPLKLAWALTVHKSQGLTFNKIIVDFSGGAFSSGQTYVALSRCTSLEGITLCQQLSERDIIVNTAVVDFSRNFNNQSKIEASLVGSRADKCYVEAVRAFDKHDYKAAVECFAEGVENKNILDNPLIRRYISRKLTQKDELYQEVEDLKRKLDVQTRTLHNLAEEYVQLGNLSLEDTFDEENDIKYGEKTVDRLNSVRVKSAIANFNKALTLWDECIDAILGKACLYYKYNEVDIAEELFFKALTLDKNNHDANYYIGCICFEKDQLDLALKSLKRALKADKNSIKCHKKLIEIYDELGFDDIAEKHRKILRKLK